MCLWMGSDGRVFCLLMSKGTISHHIERYHIRANDAQRDQLCILAACQQALLRKSNLRLCRLFRLVYQVVCLVYMQVVALQFSPMPEL